MSSSKWWTSQPENIKRCLRLYRRGDLLTAGQIAANLNTTAANVRTVLQQNMHPTEFQALKGLRYAAAKYGPDNPMWQKTGDKHPNWTGTTGNTKRTNGRLRHTARYVMEQALGLESLPSNLDVHHIDGNRSNNSLDNLALVTRKGHMQIHARTNWDYTVLRSRRLYRESLYEFMTSPSPKTIVIKRRG